MKEKMRLRGVPIFLLNNGKVHVFQKKKIREIISYFMYIRWKTIKKMNRHGVDIKKTTPHRQGRIQDFGKGGINPDYDMKTVERSEAKKK